MDKKFKSPKVVSSRLINQTFHMQEQSNLITGEKTAGGEAVKKCLKLWTLASEAVFPGLSLKRSGKGPPPSRQLPELTW